MNPVESTPCHATGIDFLRDIAFCCLPMNLFARNIVLLFVFAMLALGTRVAFCEAALSLGWDVHEHETCAAEHSHGQDEQSPCQEECESELTEAQPTRGNSIPAPLVSEIALNQSLAVAPTCLPVDRLSSLRFSDPPDGLPVWLSRSFTGRFLV